MQSMNGGICLSLLELLVTYQLECVFLLGEMCGQATGTLHGPKKGVGNGSSNIISWIPEAVSLRRI